MLGGLEEKDTVTESETATLTSTMDRAQISLEKYEESIEGVMVLEGFDDWDEENEHAIESREISDELDTLRNDVAGLLARIDEEQAATEAQEATFDRVYIELAEKAAEAQATFEIAEKYEKAATEAQKAMFDKVYNELAEKAAEAQAKFEIAKKYEADSNRFKDVSAQAGGRRPRNRYKAGGIRPSNRSGSRFKADCRNKASNIDRYRAGNMRSGSRNKASSRIKTDSMKDIGVVDHGMLIEKDAGKRGRELRSSRNKATSMEANCMEDVDVKATGKEQDSGHFTKDRRGKKYEVAVRSMKQVE